MRRGRTATGFGAFLVFASCVFVSPGRAIADDAGPDACKMAASADARALITPHDNVEIRGQSGHPAPGELTCTWSAVQRGLTDDAPPEGRLTLVYYHLVSAARAIAEMEHLAKPPQPPSLVRTEEAQDQVLRPDADTVVARHGENIAIVDAADTRSLARERAGWTYRLEAMGLAAAGAHVVGPVDARATASVCKLVAEEKVLALLTLSPSTLEWTDSPADNGLRCTFSVKDASHDPGGWVKNNGNAQFRREDLGNNAAALARLKADRPFNRPSTLLTTTDATDRVVPTADHPEEVEAVHGPYLVTLNLDDPTAAARADPTWAYRIQRTALEAAGATIVTKAGAAPDPVTPGPAPAPTAFAWKTSDHPAPSWSWLSDPVLHVVAFLARHRFILMPALIGGGVLYAIFVGSRQKPRPSRPAIIGYEPEPPPRKARGWVLAPFLIVFAIFNVTFGTWLSSTLVYAYGAEGQATITGSHGTSTVYNNHNVRGYDVLIKTVDGRVVETSFEDDEFNVYPSHNATRYPSEGDEFNVRYLTRFPGDFVILGEDGSPWAHRVSCSKLGTARAQAEAKLRFAPDMPAYRAAADAASKADADAGCER